MAKVIKEQKIYVQTIGSCRGDSFSESREILYSKFLDSNVLVSDGEEDLSFRTDDEGFANLTMVALMGMCSDNEVSTRFSSLKEHLKNGKIVIALCEEETIGFSLEKKGLKNLVKACDRDAMEGEFDASDFEDDNVVEL